MIADHTDDICDAEQVLMDDAEVAIVTIGSTSRSSLRAVHAAREQGVKAGLFRPTTVWPFPEKLFVEHLPHLKRIIVPEMNFGQLILEVERITHGHCPVVGVNKVNGELITPQEIMGEVIAHE
jgi:2-oxoglutarate ferredoxin oxidoreductase subunit alpha